MLQSPEDLERCIVEVIYSRFITTQQYHDFHQVLHGYVHSATATQVAWLHVEMK